MSKYVVRIFNGKETSIYTTKANNSAEAVDTIVRYFKAFNHGKEIKKVISTKIY